MCPWLGDFCSSYSNDVMLQTVPWLYVSFAYGVRIHPRSPPLPPFQIWALCFHPYLTVLDSVVPSRSFLEAPYSLTAWGFTSTKAKYEAQLLLSSLRWGRERVESSG